MKTITSPSSENAAFESDGVAGPRQFSSRGERLAAGRALRDRVPRKAHSVWAPPRTRRDPVEVLEESRDRMQHLVPIRYGRIFHVEEAGAEERFRDAMEDYRQSLSDDRRVLFDRYNLSDWAMKVVGIGSVGTRCLVGLFFSAQGFPLLLQFKEACRSVLEPYAGRSVYENQGQRVVQGQRLMQSSSDIFLGWTKGQSGYHFFGRQLRDMKFSAPVEGATPKMLNTFANLCGSTLARAHAKSGDASLISGYLGKSDAFDDALGEFAMAYADQTERDHAALVAAVKAGRVQALVEEDL